MKRILVVGAGFAGAVYARTLAEHGYAVRVIDRRSHLGGNAYDEVGGDGIRVHHYGPHLFHTNNTAVVEWLRRFALLTPYQHRVTALLANGTHVPLPVNRTTLGTVFDVELPDQDAARLFLQSQAEKLDCIQNARDYLHANIGRRLTDLFFRPYTRKMWKLDLEDIDAAVVQRIPVRTDDEDRYFPEDRYQFLPADGYAAMFERIFSHPNVTVELGTDFRHEMLGGHAHCFNSMPIDDFFGCDLGPLPYRSIRFHHQSCGADRGQSPTPVVNFTDFGPFTRRTDWSQLPGHVLRHTGRRTITTEEPCDDRDNDMERYYPVKTSDGRFQKLYERYRERAQLMPNLTFIGRCGTYQYLDMHQVINQSLSGARRWLTGRAQAA